MTADLMARTGLDEARLTDLVHRFYERVRADAVLGPIFPSRIRDWGPHPERMEEPILFLAIRKGGEPGLETPIAAMRADHDGHGEEIAQSRARPGGLVPPDGACRLENEALFPQFEPKG